MATKQPLVLLVDDEEDLCVNANDARTYGDKTHLAYRIEQAKELLQNNHYDACLTDLNLPDGNGLDLVQTCYTKFQHTDRSINCLWQYGYCNCST
jgi:two-component system response regulator PilR (NtrC family)